jgi:hypothetical protein
MAKRYEHESGLAFLLDGFQRRCGNSSSSSDWDLFSLTGATVVDREDRQLLLGLVGGSEKVFGRQRLFFSASGAK